MLLTLDQLRPWVEIEYGRSGGPGGQNVNKVSTRAILRFDFQHCPLILPEERSRLERRLASRVGQDGRLRVTSQRHRTQAANRRAAEDRLMELLTAALHVEKPRTPTSPTRASRRRRLANKAHRSLTLHRRKKTGTAED